jgi:predicted MFS family arabinose efflux permease
MDNQSSEAASLLAVGSSRMPDPRQISSEMLGRGSIRFLAAACGVAVANANYAQPLLVDIGQSFGLSDARVGLIPALTQFGVAAGVLLLLPLGDFVSARRLLTVTIILQIVALAATAIAPSGPVMIALALLIGFFGITPYVLPPYATLRTPLEQRGWVTALLAQGVLVGMLLARTASGFVGLHLGWRAVYALAAILMILLLIPLRRRLDPTPTRNHAGYAALMRSLAQVFLSVGVVRWSALCQALSTGSFTVLWIAIAFHMQSPEFGWHSDGVGALALIGAAAVVFAPLVGRIADRWGPRLSLLVALAVVSLAWALLAAFGHSVAGVIVGMVLLDLGATSADISNRTVIFSLYPEIRTRLATIYMVGKFAGGGVMAWLAGMVWSLGDWPAVCALGGVSAAAAALVAWAGVGRPSRGLVQSIELLAEPSLGVRSYEAAAIAVSEKRM